MKVLERFARFNAVGALGIGAQLTGLWVLVDFWGVAYPLATALSVALAVVHATGLAARRPGLPDAIALATIWPAIVGWLATTGIGIGWTLLVARHRDRRGEGRSDGMTILAWWLAAFVFVGGAAGIVVAIARRLLSD